MNLPVCNLDMPHNDAVSHIEDICDGHVIKNGKIVLYWHNDEDYDVVCKIITEFTGAGCWAFVINDKESLWNNYAPITSYKERILDGIVRNKIIKHPSDLLRDLCWSDNYFDMYMFGDDAYRVKIVWNCKDETYTITFFMSEKYKSRHIKSTQ